MKHVESMVSRSMAATRVGRAWPLLCMVFAGCISPAAPSDDVDTVLDDAVDTSVEDTATVDTSTTDTSTQSCDLFSCPQPNGCQEPVCEGSACVLRAVEGPCIPCLSSSDCPVEPVVLACVERRCERRTCTQASECEPVNPCLVGTCSGNLCGSKLNIECTNCNKAPMGGQEVKDALEGDGVHFDGTLMVTDSSDGAPFGGCFVPTLSAGTVVDNLFIQLQAVGCTNLLSEACLPQVCSYEDELLAAGRNYRFLGTRGLDTTATANVALEGVCLERSWAGLAGSYAGQLGEFGDVPVFLELYPGEDGLLIAELIADCPPNAPSCPDVFPTGGTLQVGAAGAPLVLEFPEATSRPILFYVRGNALVARVRLLGAVRPLVLFQLGPEAFFDRPPEP